MGGIDDDYRATNYDLPENKYPANFPQAVRDLRFAVKALRDDLSDRMSGLESEVHALVERVEPIEAEVQAEREERAKRAERASLLAELQAAGVPIPDGFDTGELITGVHSMGATPRLGWLREALELAATPGGTRVLGVLAVVLLGPDAVHLASSLVDLWREPTPIVVPADGNDDDHGADFPNIGPPTPPSMGPLEDSPAAPRPNL